MHQRIQPAGARTHRRQLRHGQRTEQRVDCAGHPYRHEERDRGKPRRDFAWGTQDAHADRVADQNGQAECDAQHLQQAPVRQFLARCVWIYQTLFGLLTAPDRTTFRTSSSVARLAGAVPPHSNRVAAGVQ